MLVSNDACALISQSRRKVEGYAKRFIKRYPMGPRHLPIHLAVLTHVSQGMYPHKVRAVARLLTLASQQLVPGSVVRLASTLLISTIKSVNDVRAVLTEGHLILPRVL